ncbi:MAG: serine protease, partial [Thermoleophilia bacterium]|nr:serine protease [Thermoleophilia bacterium]
MTTKGSPFVRVRSFLTTAIVLSVALITALPATSSGALAPLTPRIINGNTVSANTYAHRWNFIVRLVDPAEPQVFPYGGFCGGSLISSRLVLTAAHCVTRTSEVTGVTTFTKPLAMQVVVNNGPTLPSNGSEIRVPVTRITVHPNFDGSTLDNDLALVQLGTVPSGSNWAPITIVDTVGDGINFGDEQWGDGTGMLNSDDGPWTAGWGNRSTNPDPSHGNFSPTLEQVEIPIKADSACQSNFDGTDATNPFHPVTMICAGTNSKDDHDPNPKDTCQGDSGGPLIVWSGLAGNPG